MRSSTTAGFAIAALVAMTIQRLLAHDVPIEHVVDVAVEPRGSEVFVHARLPAAGVRDANLPHLADGTLDPNAGTDRLRLVASDFARSFDLQQDDVTLPATVEAARVGADRASVEVELKYATGGDGALSGRLNAVRAPGAPVRTNFRYRPASGGDHALSVTGQPERLTFDPPIGQVLADFVGRGVRALLGGGDHLLFLMCVLLPMRRSRFAAAIFATAAAGQALAIGWSAVSPASTEAAFPILSMIAASAVVVAALQNIVRARERLVLGVALAFGVLSGFSLGHELVLAAPYAWSHRGLASISFAATLLAGELWLALLAWATRTWLDERGLPERLAAVVASALIIHIAVHRFVDRGHAVASAGGFAAERALVWVTLIWLGLMLLVAIAGALSDRGRDRRLADTAGANA